MHRVVYFVLGVLSVVFGKDIARFLIKGFISARQELEGLAAQIAEDIEDEAAEAEYKKATASEDVPTKARQ